MFDSVDSAQLLVKISSDNLYPKLIEQLNKDFRLSGLVQIIPLSTNQNGLHQLLSSIIYKLINQNFSDYLNLLYRIDISESEIKKLNGSDIEELSKQVSYLILKRECQKVWIRNTL